MKILIIGGTGFIGTHLLKRLTNTNHALRCLVRHTSNTEQVLRAKAELVIGDVTDRETVFTAMHGCDAVINLANIYDFWQPNKKIYKTVNVQGTWNIMEAALINNISKVIHVSSLVVYGNQKQKPLNEESPPGKRRYSRYAKTKLRGEQIGWFFRREKRLPLVVIYPGCVLGPGDTKPSGHFIDAVVQERMPFRILSNSKMSYVHVKDVVEIIVRALEKQDNLGEKYFAAAETISFGQCLK